MLSDVYQHNIRREISLSTWSLLALRLQLYQRFEEWRQQLDPRLRLITPQEICTVLTSQIEENRFRITLTVHYYRALIMLNGPVIKNLLDIVVNSSRADEADESLFEQSVPTIKSDLVVLENLNHILCIISQSEEFMNHNNVRWISNHACSILAMHLFCLALLYHIRPELEAKTITSASRIRDLLGQCLDNMKVLQRTSTLFRKAREALEVFTQKLDSVRIKELPTPGASASGIGALPNSPPRHYEFSMNNDFFGQPEFDLLLGDGFYC
ncbi:unnamed protein product [Alternaria alternata]